MQADQFLAALHKRPFVPFVIHTARGERYVVRLPERAAISPTGRTVAVFLPKEDTAIFDMGSITEIVAAPSPDRRKKGEP